MFDNVKRFYYVVDISDTRTGSYVIGEKLFDSGTFSNYTYSKFLDFIARNNPYGIKSVLLLPLAEQNGGVFSTEIVKKISITPQGEEPEDFEQRKMFSMLSQFWVADDIYLESRGDTVIIDKEEFSYELVPIEYSKAPKEVRMILENDKTIDPVTIKEIKNANEKILLVIFKRAERGKVKDQQIIVVVPRVKVSPTKFVAFLSKLLSDQQLFSEVIESIGFKEYSMQVSPQKDYARIVASAQRQEFFEFEFDNRFGQAVVRVKLKLTPKREVLAGIIQMVTQIPKNEFWKLLLPESLLVALKYIESPYDMYYFEKYLLTGQSIEGVGKILDPSHPDKIAVVPLQVADIVMWAIHIYASFGIREFIVELADFGCVVNKGQLTFDTDNKRLIVIDPANKLSSEIISLLEAGYKYYGYKLVRVS